MQSMTSRERVLATVRRQPADHLPICFEGICHGMTRFVHQRHPDPRERVRFFLERGADVALSHSPPTIGTDHFTVRHRQERAAGEPNPLLVKEYVTPDGTLRQVIRYTPDYDQSILGPSPQPGQVRMFADDNVPASRSREYLVGGKEHLPALRHILRPIGRQERETYLREMRERKEFCRQEGVLLGAYLAGVSDPIFWMSGVERILMAALEEPEFVAEYVDIVAAWNLANLQLMLEGGAEYIVRRGWYSTADFWSPALHRQFLLQPLRAETRLARQAGAVFAYCMNSGVMPMVDELAESGIDVLCNLDPTATQTNLSELKRRLGGTITLCGGVNNHHVLEHGTVEEVHRAVADAVKVLAPGGGCILAPGDSILDVGPTAQRNFEEMIKAWRQLR